MTLNYPADFPFACVYCEESEDDCSCQWGYEPGCCKCFNDLSCACGNPGALLDSISDSCACKPVLAAMRAERYMPKAARRGKYAHIILRDNPKGQKGKGYCPKCGAEELDFSDLWGCSIPESEGDLEVAVTAAE